MTRRLAWPIVACVSGALLGLFVLAGVTGPVRLLLTLWFLTIGTGMSIVPALDIPAPRVELLIGVAMSIAIDTLIATALAAVGDLTLGSAIITLMTVCLLGTAVSVARERRQPGWPR
jgi:hypothetical protein